MGMDNLSPEGTPLASGPLTRAVLEIDEYASGLGWDQPARLFALVNTERLRAEEPGLAGQLGLDQQPDSARGTSFTPVEQDEISADVPLDEFLGTIAWPPLGRRLRGHRGAPDAAAVRGGGGAAGPRRGGTGPLGRRAPRAQRGADDGGGPAGRGESSAALRLREKDSATEVLTGGDLVPGLAEALAATFAE